MIAKQLPDIPLRLSLCIIIVLSLCCLNSYNGGFVFDDSEAIVNNKDVKDSPLKDVFENDFWGAKLSRNDSHKSYRPLTILSFRFHYWLRGSLDPLDFHIANILLYTTVCVFAFLVFRILLPYKQKRLSFYATAIFAIHPIHVEAVAGVVGRAELLSALFAFLTTIFYSKCISAKRCSLQCFWMIASAICIFLATCCKETGITIVGICAVYDVVLIQKLYPVDLSKLIFIKLFKEKSEAAPKLQIDCLLRLLALFICTVLLLSIRFSLMGFTVPTFQVVDNPASEIDNFTLRMVNYNYIYCLNLWLLICPEWLCFDWSMGCVPLILELFDPRILGVVALWIALVPFLHYSFINKTDRYYKSTVIALATLIIPFLPAANIFFKVGFVVAERTLFLPSAGYCLLLAIGLEKVYSRVSPKILLLYIALIVLFFTRSWIRSSQWTSEKSLFQSALNVCPLNAKVHYNIAKNAADRGDVAIAELEYRESIRLYTNYSQAMNNLGNLLKDQGRYSEAESLLLKATDLKKDFATAWMNLGIVQSALKKYRESEKSYFTALRHRKKYPDCYYNLGVLYLDKKEHEKALNAWKNAIEQKPSHRQSWINMILLLDELGIKEKGLLMARKAIEQLPNDASIYFNAANICGKLERYSEAEELFKRAIKTDSTNPTFYTNLGVLYHRWNKLKEAREMYKKALQINPSLQSARDNLRRLENLLRKIK